MTIRKGNSGSGITEGPTYSWDDNNDEQDPEIAALLKMGTFDGLLKTIEDDCFAVMREHGLPDHHGSWVYSAEGEWYVPKEGYWRDLAGKRIANVIWPIAQARGHDQDDPVGFAARMLGDAVWARRHSEKGDWLNASMHMFYLGAKWASRRIKFDHEPAWETGSKQRSILGDIRDRQNERRKFDAEQRHTEWQEQAEMIWMRTPALTKSAVSKIIARTTDHSHSTIRQVIQKPDSAG